MKGTQKERSAVVKAGMERLCRDFTQVIAPLGFRRTSGRSRVWERRVGQLIQVIYFHHDGSTYGAPISFDVSIRVHFSLKADHGAPTDHDQLDSDRVRDGRGYAYHLRFNAHSWSMYDRCVDDLVRVTREHGLPWFERIGTTETK